jgi:lysophospholipase L1-like esterase
MKSLFKYLILVLITPIFLIILVGLIEGYNFIIRDTDRTKMYDEELGWSNFPNKIVVKDKITYTTNSDGLRSEEVDPGKDKIIIVGDSVAYGAGIQDNETAAYYLDQEFPHLQVLNLGVGGYGIGQYYLRLKKIISKLKPKIIGVVICTGNDIRNTQSNVSYGYSKPLFKIDEGKLRTIEPSISRFTCPNLFSTSWLLQKSPFASLRNKYCSTGYLSSAPIKEIVMKLFSEINELANLNNSKLFYVLWPSQSNFDDKQSILNVLEEAKKKDPKNYAKLVVDSTPFYFKNNWSAFKKWFSETDYLTLDFLEKTKESYNLEESKKLYIDHYHMSPEGSKLLSSEIKKFIEQKQLL